MILSDAQILKLATEQEMISPYVPQVIREVNGMKVISYGQSSYGYDIRLSPAMFKIFSPIGGVMDPKAFDSNCMRAAKLHESREGMYFILPAHTYGLGVALERIKMPKNVTATCVGKSTYARSGIIANVTPVEAGWEGHLTLEISNSSACDFRVYANEGICQLLFHQGAECLTSYEDRKGKYQGQAHEITFSRV